MLSCEDESIICVGFIFGRIAFWNWHRFGFEWLPQLHWASPSAALDEKYVVFGSHRRAVVVLGIYYRIGKYLSIGEI